MESYLQRPQYGSVVEDSLRQVFQMIFAQVPTQNKLQPKLIYLAIPIVRSLIWAPTVYRQKNLLNIGAHH